MESAHAVSARTRKSAPAVVVPQGSPAGRINVLLWLSKMVVLSMHWRPSNVFAPDSPASLRGFVFCSLPKCRRFCDGQSFKLQHGSTSFNNERATGSTSINYKLQISTDINNGRNLVRDQGVGGSNPLSPTNLSLAHSVGYAALAASD